MGRGIPSRELLISLFSEAVNQGDALLVMFYAGQINKFRNSFSDDDRAMVTNQIEIISQLASRNTLTSPYDPCRGERLKQVTLSYVINSWLSTKALELWSQYSLTYQPSLSPRERRFHSYIANY